jgi:hypothetical protein
MSNTSSIASDNNPSSIVIIETEETAPSQYHESYEEVDDDAPKDVIDEIYKSMHQLMKALTAENMLRDKQMNMMKKDFEDLCDTYNHTKMELYQMVSGNTADISSALENADDSNSNVSNSRLDKLEKDLYRLKLQKDSTVDNSDLQKQIMSNRSMLLKTLQANVQTLRQELMVARMNPPNITGVVEQVVSSELDKRPSVDEKFDKFAKEQKSTLSRHIRNSTMQTNTSMK